MYIQSSKILPIFIRYGVALFLLFSVVGIIVNENFRTITNPYSYDEIHFYQPHAANFTINHFKDVYNSNMESNPITFLTLYKILDNANPVVTRTFNLFLILICTYLLYKITNNKVSFLYILIPVFLDSMWLTLEIVEIFFILLSMLYVKKSGIFVGLAMIFRPTAILYAFLVSNRQKLSVVAIGILFSILLLAMRLFFPYLHEVSVYAKDGFPGLDMLVVVILFMLTPIGLNKQILPYIIVSAIPLLVKTYPHYFLPLFTFLFLGFLLNMNKDIKDISEKQ